MFYRPVAENRYFSPGVKYDPNLWRDFRIVVQRFRTRIEKWYLEPATMLHEKSWNHAFTIMAIDCLLIDTLSQYEADHIRSSGRTFRAFAASNFPPFAQNLPTPIRLADGNQLVTFAEVLWTGFRCGILHEVHIALYGGMAGLRGKLCDVDTDVCMKYDDGSDCPTVRMDPGAILKEVKRVFHDYVIVLLIPDRRYNRLRQKFKRKFQSSFGIDLSHSTL
jgi:hypothetical protein